jgi:DNA replication protein DnaC
MSTVPASLQEASIHAHCKTLRIPTIAAQYSRIADQATRQGHSHVRYLEALLATEVEERQQRRIAWRLSEAKLPKVKTLEDFDFNASSVSTTQVRSLADGSYLDRAEPVIFLGERPT